MAGSNKGLEQALNLLQGNIDASGLETELTSGGSDNPLGAFKLLIGDRFYFRQIMDDAAAVAAIFGSATARAAIEASERSIQIIANSSKATLELSKYTSMLVKVLSTKSIFDYYRNNAGRYANLKATVNASGSKLDRFTFNSSGGYAIGSIAALCIVAIGGGGRGGGSTSPNLGGGGGGGECQIVTMFSGLPVVDQSVTVGSGGPVATNSSFGTIAVALKGSDAFTSTGGAGGGTTTGNGLSDVSDVDILNAPWQFKSVKIKGGAGGSDGDALGLNGLSQYFGKGGDAADVAGGLNGTANKGVGGGGSTSGSVGEGSTGVVVTYRIFN